MTHFLLRKALPLAIATVLAGCETLDLPLMPAQEEAAPIESTLADLQPVIFEAPVLEPRAVAIDEVIASYELLLEMSSDPDTRLLAMQRLADLRLERGETRLYAEGQAELTQAEAALEELLVEFPDHASNDRVLYQLAKTRDLQGDAAANMATLDQLLEEHPDSRYRAEVQFRRGEILFSQGDYVAAQAAFEDVLRTREPQFEVTANYMRGWCLFKQTRFEEAQIAFITVLDLLLPEGMLITSIDQQNQTLVEDLLRVMGLGFTYEGGAEAIPRLFARTGSRPYEFLVYDRYAQLLLENEQYTDAIGVYKTFIGRYPASLYAPQYQQRVIDATIQAGFASSVLEEKERFIRDYGPESAFWLATNPIDLDFTQERLSVYLPELAAVHYNLGRKARTIKPATPRSLETTWKEYGLAAEYYQAFVTIFPEDEQAPQMAFLLGESHAAREDWLSAIDAWELSGFDYPKYDGASEAAYAAVLAYDQAIAQVTGEDEASQALRKELTLRQRDTRLRFVAFHSQDSRAPDVLYATAAESYESKEYVLVINYSEQLLNWQPPLPEARQREARLLRAHSLFALEDYIQAEEAYARVLEEMPRSDSRRSGVEDNMAASIYRQAEDARSRGLVDLAVASFLRVGQRVPDSSIRVNAEYDAASYLMEVERWQEAIPILEDFRKRYPGHSLTAGIAGKLALAYQQTEQWSLAAGEVGKMGGADETPEAMRERMLIVADLQDRSGDKAAAIIAYRSYANQYPEPVEDYMDSAVRLSELYKETGETEKRRFWLRKQTEAYERAGDQANDRMRYQAASAANELAGEAYERFAGIQLKLPLQKSLPAKTQAMREALQSYQKVTGYGVAEFATQAGYRMADLYALLSRDLMDSDRPDGLSELELEQYDILLEEQAFPFEENAIAIHEQNIQRSWEGVYDEWVKSSFDALARLFPARYRKEEIVESVSESL